MTTTSSSPSPTGKRFELHAVCRPGLIIHLLFPGARRERGLSEGLVDYAASTPYYGAVEIAEVEDQRERQAIRRICRETDLRLVYWLSILQMECSESISSPYEPERRRAVAVIKRQIPFAAECGAHAIGIVSGRDVEPEDRLRAIQSLEKSILELSAEAQGLGLGRIEMETMDRDAHKKHVLGPTSEAVPFIEMLRHLGVDLHLVFDTAHICLLREDVPASLAQAAHVTGHIHLANCVADPGDSLFGDNHMPIGEPGFLTPEVIGSLVRHAVDVGVLGVHRPVVSVEVGANGGEGAWQLERASRSIMEGLFP
jgi:sugar phosphate isomerase/epimerase